MILTALTVIVLVKLEFRLPHSNTALYAYGVTVTAVVLLQMSIAFMRYRDLAVSGEGAADDRKPTPTRAGALPVVSFMVAVHNEELVLESCIRSLSAQTYFPREIIVVDDASTDGTPALLDKLCQRYDMKVIKLERNVGKKRALAAAMLEATGAIFAFSDSDSVWAPDAVERTIRIFQAHPDVGAVSGHCRALNATTNTLTKMQDSWYEGQFSVRKAFESAFGAVTCVSGPLAVFRREAIFNFVPAWTSDRFCGQEFRFATDRTLTAFVLLPERRAHRLRQKHQQSPFATPVDPWRRWRVVYSKSARAWTVVPETPRQLLMRQVRWKKSFLRNAFFTGSFYWQRPFIPALAYYLHVLFVLAGPFVAFRHLVYLPLHGNAESALLYLFGIVFIGSMFALAYRREDPTSGRGFYRPLMSLLSTVVLSWLVFYSIATIRRMHWARA